jgi:hypothetical protein
MPDEGRNIPNYLGYGLLLIESRDDDIHNWRGIQGIH